MSQSRHVELSRDHRALVEKQTYFLLASAGACLGFAMTQAKDLILMLEHASLGLALLCWGVSFWCGCIHISRVVAHMAGNVELLRLNSGLGGYQHHDPNVLQVVADSMREALERHSLVGHRFARMQFLFLIVGVLCYVVWQVLLMLART